MSIPRIETIMAPAPLSMRRVLAVALSVLAVLSAASSIALVLITSMMHRTNEAIGYAVERREMTEDCQRDLHLRARAVRDDLRTRLASDVIERLEVIERTASDSAERSAAADAVAAVDRTIAGGNGQAAPDPHEALAVLERVQRERVRDARAQARTLDDVANVVGLGTGALVFGGTLAMLAWLNRRVVRPLLRVAHRIRAYGRGDTSARAEENGPREIRDMARAFNATADRVEQQRAAHATFLAGVAHDLRNPLQVLAVAVSLDPGAGREGSPTVERVLGIVKRQLARLERLVGDLLDTANLQAGRLRLRNVDLDLREVVRDVAGLFRSASQRHRILVTIPDEEVLTTCDAERIEQVLVNLVSNAIKYSPDGGVVRISLARKGTVAVLAVEDEGIGMTDEQAAGVFRPFARAATLRDSVPGHGLGLFVADRIVQAHGGSIHVESTVGVGSVFRVELPSKPPERNSTAHEAGTPNGLLPC